MTTQEAYALAVDHFRAGRFAQAEFVLQQVLAREPQHSDAQHLMGLLCHRYGHTPVAVGFVRRAIGLKPASAEFYNSLATLLADQDNVDLALAAAKQALALRPDFPEALCNLASLLARKGELDQASGTFRRALALRPDYPEAELQLGKLLKQIGQIEQAAACFRWASDAASDSRIASALLHALYFLSDCDASQIAAEHAQWDLRFAKAQAAKIRPHANDGSHDRKLRIGYVSPNFRDHFVGRLLAPLLANHDREQFEVYCYCDVERPDEITRRFDSFDHVWRSTVGISDDDLAQQVRRDRIDILVDLSLHLEGNRLLAFAQKPAPVQATYLAYCGTSGLESIDYRFTDSCVDRSAETIYVERPLQLSSYHCYEPPHEAPEVGLLPAHRAGHVTFGCLNDYSKVTPPVWSAWRELLRKVEGSTLLVHSPPGGHRDQVRAQFGQDGVDPQRVQFVDRTQRNEYFQRYSQIDIALDPFPYPGGLTTCDALWMGVPVVTLAGATGVSRSGLSILSAAGLAEFAASTPQQYVTIAADLASDVSRLTNLRSSLRDRLRHSALTNAAAFVQSAESAYRTIWSAWCGAR